MYKEKKVTGVILCAGSGSRFGIGINKVYEMICDRPLISYSMEKFSNHPYIDDLVIVTKPEEVEMCKEVAEIYCNLDKTQIIYGGKERQESVYNALQITDGEIVIIHDGARPLVTDKMISDCIEAMEEYSGVTIGVKSKDTIKITDDNGIVSSTTVRKNTWIIQTPQCFDLKLLMEGHELANRQELGVTDDCMIIENMGKEVKLIEGEYSNIKVTIQEDLILAEMFMNQREQGD